MGGLNKMTDEFISLTCAVQVWYGRSTPLVLRDPGPFQLTPLFSQCRTYPHSPRWQHSYCAAEWRKRTKQGSLANCFLRNIPRNCHWILLLPSYCPEFSEVATPSCKGSWVKQSSFGADTCPTETSIKMDEGGEMDLKDNRSVCHSFTATKTRKGTWSDSK